MRSHSIVGSCLTSLHTPTGLTSDVQINPSWAIDRSTIAPTSYAASIAATNLVEIDSYSEEDFGVTGQDTGYSAPDGVELLPPPIRPQDMTSSDVEIVEAAGEVDDAGDVRGTLGGDTESAHIPNADVSHANDAELVESRGTEEVAASVEDSAQMDEPHAEAIVETDSLGTEELVEVELDSDRSGERDSAEELEMYEQVAEEVATEIAELNADIPDEVEVVQYVENSLSEEEMTERNEFAAHEVGPSESEMEETETEFESPEDTDAGADAAPDVEKTAVVAQQSASAESEPTHEGIPESETGEESQPEATSEPAPEVEPERKGESEFDISPDAEVDTQTSATKPDSDTEAKTVAQVSAIVMAIAVIVLWLLLR